jgi:DNA-binding MarR family transcriptional regulator
MPNKSQSPTKKRQLWANRYRKLKSWVQSLPPLLVLRAEKFISVFFKRKSLSLRLSDNYLIKLWGNISRATVQRTLQKLEQLGLLRRLTASAQKQSDGSWTQQRKLVLLLPKSLSYLVSHSARQPELEDKPLAKNSTQSVKQRDFVDYLIDQRRVTKGAWAFWLRKNDAAPQTFGYLMGSIHQRIKNRPDVLESILFDGLEQKLRGKQLVGFTISEIKARTTA